MSPNTRQLTKDDHIHILRLAIGHGDAWGHGTNAAFWTKIANLFEKTTGKKHKTLGRAVDQLVKARRKAIEEEDSGENELQCSYTDAVDDWISIVDNHKALVAARKEAQGRKDQETEDSNKWRNDSLRLFVDRDEPGWIARKRKASQVPRLADVEAGAGTWASPLDGSGGGCPQGRAGCFSMDWSMGWLV